METKKPRTEAQLYADQHLRHGRPMNPEARYDMFSIRFNAAEKARLMKEAAAAGVTVAELVRRRALRGD